MSMLTERCVVGFNEVFETFATAERVLEDCELRLHGRFPLGGAHGCGFGF